MTKLLGRSGFWEAPTPAIVRASRRICSGDLTPPTLERIPVVFSCVDRGFQTAYGRSPCAWGRYRKRRLRPTILRSVPDRIRVACVQMTSRADKAANLEAAERLVAQAAATGADV